MGEMVDRLKTQVKKLVEDVVPPRFMGLQTTRKVIEPEEVGGGVTGWCRGVLKTACTSDLDKVPLTFDQRLNLEFYTGSLRDKTIACSSYFE